MSVRPSQQSTCVGYKVLNRIGSGAYGMVYKGRREDDKQMIALKRVFIKDQDGGVPLSTHRELNALQKLSNACEFVVKLYDVIPNKIDNEFCIDLIFELMPYDLEQFMKKFQADNLLSMKKIINLSRQLIEGIYFMHVNRVIHRDLKPANILIDEFGRKLKITDFGLARILGFDACLTPDVVTLWYRSPEILLHNNYSFPCDVWSGGCIIGEMIAGKPLFDGNNEIRQLYYIITRLDQSEVIESWSPLSKIDISTSLISNNESNIDVSLARAPRDFRRLIKEMLRFNPQNRIMSTEALKQLSELRELNDASILRHANGHTYFPTTSNNIHSIKTTVNQYESPNQLIVNSVVRNVLDDDFNQPISTNAFDYDLSELSIPELEEPINQYLHEEVEIVNEGNSVVGNDLSSLSSSSSLDVTTESADETNESVTVVNNDKSKIPPQSKSNSQKEGDSFSSYRSQNDLSSFSNPSLCKSYASSSQSDVDAINEDNSEDETDTEDECDQTNDFNEGLNKFKDNFLISDENTNESVICHENNTGNFVSSVHTYEKEIKKLPSLNRTNSGPLKELNTFSNNICNKVQNKSPVQEQVRKRNLSSEGEELIDNVASANGVIVNNHKAYQPTRASSLRRRLTMHGDHIATGSNRRQSSLLLTSNNNDMGSGGMRRLNNLIRPVITNVVCGPIRRQHSVMQPVTNNYVTGGISRPNCAVRPVTTNNLDTVSIRRLNTVMEPRINNNVVNGSIRRQNSALQPVNNNMVTGDSRGPNNVLQPASKNHMATGSIRRQNNILKPAINNPPSRSYFRSHNPSSSLLRSATVSSNVYRSTIMNSTIPESNCEIVPLPLQKQQQLSRFNSSFGESSLTRALDNIPNIDSSNDLPNSPALSDRPKVLARRRSHQQFT